MKLPLLILSLLFGAGCAEAVVTPANANANLSHQPNGLKEHAMNMPLTGELSIEGTDKRGKLTVALTVTHQGQSEITAHFTSGMGADLWLKDRDNRRVWAWSQEMMFTQALRETQIFPGQVLTYKFAVPQPALSSCLGPCRFEAIFAGTTAGRTPLMAPVVMDVSGLAVPVILPRQ
ncbi:BsuPI-related putative proteinase inhibitor [Shewanella litorisediminis]|uniref:Intracellular proteinase inhibitor BsuPI domain-containing protein n=1 Tax=Shewanella litorisediminis TaxID=1173586 RepID=A0ABX7FYQ8_9GAMM|nr:BsuPI-related putative proteinase inhibitor [Shewanella litorisediminis]MCL2918857.1 BsuPI-related putative proteinase inhibitor [Shewanella litorisediminis]QRH00177.1 hypothetical protein JQC75_09650 [Shewanella litorisediminis]